MKPNQNFHRVARYHCGQIRSTSEVEVNSKFHRLLPNQRPNKRSSAVRRQRSSTEFFIRILRFLGREEMDEAVESEVKRILRVRLRRTESTAQK